MSNARRSHDEAEVPEEAAVDAEPEAEVAEPEAAPEPEPEPVDAGNWQPTIVEPAPEVPVEAIESVPARPVLPEGDVVVVYRGYADLAGPVEYDGVSYSFRNGEPVTVPSNVAEEVLTWPNETFEVVTTED